MLTSLCIENLAIVKHVTFSPDPRFTVLTGETGAGKSMILDAIHLLSGEGGRNAKQLVRTGEDTATVSAMLEDLRPATLSELETLGIAPDQDGVLYLQRTLSKDGRSRALCNGRPIPLSLLKEVGLRLWNIHGQHDSYALLNPAKHKTFLDHYGGHETLLSQYRACYQQMTATQKELAQCDRDEREKLRQSESLKEQIAEIDRAKLRPGEEEALLAKRIKVRNAEKIAKQSRTVYRALFQNERGASACSLIRLAEQSLEQLQDFLPKGNDYLERLESCCSELEDIAECVRDLNEGEEDPQGLLDRIEGRLELFRKLQRKYGADNEAVLAYREEAAARLQAIDENEQRKELLTKRLKTEREAAEKAGKALTDARKTAAEQLSRAIMAELAFLEMGKVTFCVFVEPYPEENAFTPDGCDHVEFLVATNTGESCKPMAQIASGGELSRIMLALKCVLADADGIETMIFDEIDTGISGKISQKVGFKLKQTALSSQVICVTHAAQIAALGDTHLHVWKADQNGRTETSVKPLSEEERIGALAAMMGGANITETLLSSARELRATPLPPQCRKP